MTKRLRPPPKTTLEPLLSLQPALPGLSADQPAAKPKRRTARAKPPQKPKGDKLAQLLLPTPPRKGAPQ